MVRPISIGLSPNTSKIDYLQALKSFVTPWKWKNGEAILKVEEWFSDYFDSQVVALFDSGRSALYALLSTLELPPDSEVMLQAFTCVAVPNSVRWARLKPVFVDIDETFNFDVSQAQKKLTSNTKVVIVQHTFGFPADMDSIGEFCKKHNLILIEDCAHAFGATYKGKLIGTFGDGAFFSFGRDKIVSSVSGGLAMINKKSVLLASKSSEKLLNFHNSLSTPGFFWIMQQLLHPLIMSLVLPLYNLELGKLILFIAQKLRLVSYPVSQQEMKGKKTSNIFKKYPNALAELLLIQLAKLHEMNARRRQIAMKYFQELKHENIKTPSKNSESIYLRFPMLIRFPDALRFEAKKHRVILGNWYSNVIDPKGVDIETIGCTLRSCPDSEKAASRIVNLPTYPVMTDSEVKTVVTIVKNYAIKTA